MPMRVKEKLNNQGAALLFSILLLLILSILGVTLISVAISNLKINKISGEMNTAIYMADGAIEEALSEINEITHEAEATASQWINDPSMYKSTSQWHNFMSMINERLNYDGEDESIIPLTEAEATQMIEEHLENEFENKYFGQLTDDSALKEEHLQLLRDVKFRPTFDDKRSVELRDLDITSEYIVNDKKITVSIISQAAYNKYNKKMSIELDIILPKYDYIIANEKYNKKIYFNNIYKRALTSEENIMAVGGDVNINGDIYAYGTFPEEVWPRNENVGGVIAGYKNLDGLTLPVKYQNKGSISVNGHVLTRTNIQTAKDNSSINISKKAYCDSLLINENSRNGSVTVDGQVIMYDDAEINGLNGKIIINDDLWGVFSEDPGGNYNDRSSSIIINSDGGSEKIDIAGGAFLGGTAYISAYKKSDFINNGLKNYYQTGESVSLSKYSSIYQVVLPEESYVELVPYTDEVNDFNFVVDTQSETNGVANAEFKIQHFLRYAYLYKDDNDKKILAKDKAKITINAIDVNDAEQKKNSYAFGAVVANGRIYNPNPNNTDSYFIDSWDYNFNKLPSVLKEIDEKANLLKDRNYAKSENKTSRFNEFFNESIDITNDITDYNNFLLINLDSSKDIYINPDSDIFVPEGSISLHRNGSISGILLTKGNVYIGGTLDYKGTMISHKNIVFYGDGEKNIQYDEDKIITMLAKNKDLFQFFYGDTGRKIQTDGNSATNSLQVSVEENNIYDSDGIKPYKEFTVDNISSIGSNKKENIKTYNINTWKEVN